jgi:hypothetical protein
MAREGARGSCKTLPWRGIIEASRFKEIEMSEIRLAGHVTQTVSGYTSMEKQTAQPEDFPSFEAYYQAVTEELSRDADCYFHQSVSDACVTTSMEEFFSYYLSAKSACKT